MVVTSVLDRIRKIAVRAGVLAFLNSIGLLSISYRTYWRITSYLHHGDVIERSFDDVQAVFEPNDWKEMRHLHGDFEEEVLGDLFNHVKTNSVFFDVGAHIGIYTCWAAQAVDEVQ